MPIHAIDAVDAFARMNNRLLLLPFPLPLMSPRGFFFFRCVHCSIALPGTAQLPNIPTHRDSTDKPSSAQDRKRVNEPSCGRDSCFVLPRGPWCASRIARRPVAVRACLQPFQASSAEPKHTGPRGSRCIGGGGGGKGAKRVVERACPAKRHRQTQTDTHTHNNKQRARSFLPALPSFISLAGKPG